MRRFDTFVGTVTGSVDQQTDTHRDFGVPALVFSSLLGVGAVVVHTVTGSGRQNLMSILLTAVVLLCLLLIYQLILGRWFGRLLRGATRVLRRAGSRLTGTVTRLAWQVIRRGATPSSAALPVRHFQVQTLAGEIVPCLLRGELVGAEPRPGDTVRISGHRRLDGRYAVRRLARLSGPAGTVLGRTHGRLPPAYLALRAAGLAGHLLSVLVLLWAVALIR